MKLAGPAGKVERLGFYKGGPGFTIIPTAIFRFRRELGLDRNTLLVLLAVLSHSRQANTDYCEVAYSVLVTDTGLHKSVVCRCIRILLAQPDSDVVVSTRKKTPDRKTSKAKLTVKGLGLLGRATTPALSRGGKRKFVWREGGPKRDTNVYFLGPLAERLQALLRPDEVPGGADSAAAFGKPRYIEFEPEHRFEDENDSTDHAEEYGPLRRARFGKPRYDFECEPEHRFEDENDCIDQAEEREVSGSPARFGKPRYDFDEGDRESCCDRETDVGVEQEPRLPTGPSRFGKPRYDEDADEGFIENCEVGGGSDGESPDLEDEAERAAHEVVGVLIHPDGRITVNLNS